MNTKAIGSFSNNATGQSATVRFDTVLQEYRVVFYDADRNHMKEADYFTTEKDDAIGTAMRFAKAKAPGANERKIA
jgi:hypothetical protein